MRRLAPILVVPLLLLPTRLLAQGQADDARWRAACQDWEHGDQPVFCDVVVKSVADPAATVSFDGGRNGGVQYVGWDGSGMEVHARIQAHADTEDAARALARSIRFEIGPNGGRATGPDDARWSVVYRVFVPRARNLEATSHNGPLSAEGVRGRIRLESHNGPIHLKDVGGDVVARDRNGPLSVVLTGSTWEGEKLDAETRNGPVSVSFPKGYAAVLETGTENGPFETDVPLTVTLGPGRSAKRFQVVLGDGGPHVRVVTTNGPASIHSR